jgi:arylsulfatase A-like enzyme
MAATSETAMRILPWPGAPVPIPVLAIGLFLAIGGCSRRSGPENVVLISLDTLRADRLGLYGYERETSPFLDGLARESVVFDAAQTPAPWTLPAHAAMLASRYPSTLHVGSVTAPRPVANQVLTLAEVLASEGFRTHAVVDGGFVSMQLGFAQGFADFKQSKPLRGDAFGYRADRVVARAAKWLRGIRRGERFFLFLHTYAVHDYKPTPAPRARLVRSYTGPLARLLSVSRFLQDRANEDLFRALGPADRRFISDLYDATVLEADESVLRLHETLRELDLLDDTLVVVTSDHGEEIFDHQETGHGYSMYQENLHVPLLFSHRSLPPMRVSSPVRLLDIPPTIVDLLGLEQPPAWQGVSLVPLMRGEQVELAAVSEEALVPLQAVRLGCGKLIRAADGSRSEGYDLCADPAERENLVGTGSRHEVALHHAFEQWQRSLEPSDDTRSRAEAPLDPHLRKQLEQLGYLDGADPAATGH